MEGRFVIELISCDFCPFCEKEYKNIDTKIPKSIREKERKTLVSVVMILSF